MGGGVQFKKIPGSAGWKSMSSVLSSRKWVGGKVTMKEKLVVNRVGVKDKTKD